MAGFNCIVYCLASHKTSNLSVLANRDVVFLLKVIIMI